jgi:hypothetical protein
MFRRFGAKFPPTREFSKFARDRISADRSDPDGTLLRWWQTEEALFRAFENRELSARLGKTPPFKDVNDFLDFSLSVQNRRKSRAGHALENHTEALLSDHGIRAARNSKTEGTRKPDFLMPGEREYQDLQFPTNRLHMLGVKTTCKDRWRQVLDEAARIPVKHLLTLEPAISADQLNQMADARVILVAPSAIRKTYEVPHGVTVLTVAEFLRWSANLQRS